jgi:uncharacterized lipoprotein YddW (UPF0748 family)
MKIDGEARAAGAARRVRWAAALLAIATAAPAAAQSTRTRLDEIAPFRRLIWVSRFEYKTPGDIQRIFYNAASARFTDVLFQVRGEGTVYFRSPIEPWAFQLSGRSVERGVGVDPGWDPLTVALSEARRYGLRVHAYVNVMPAWAQEASPPKESGQLYVARKSWLMTDRRGDPMKPNGFYAFLDPSLPEVRQYLARLFAQLAHDYPLHGIHLDYIRYPHPDEAPGYGFHPRALQDFKAWSGGTPESRPEAWNEFRRAQVAATVRGIRDAVRSVKPGIEISAAVYAEPSKARESVAQDSPAWVAEGLVDWIAPMIYVAEGAEFERRLAPFSRPPLRDRVYIGVQAKPGQTQFAEQIGQAVSRRFPGVAVFSYGGLYNDHAVTQSAIETYRAFVGARPDERLSMSDPIETKLRDPGIKIVLP